MNMRRLAMILLVLMPTGLWAQNTGLTIATVTRPPFSMIQDGKDSGFSIELWNAVANELGVETTFKRADSFAEMLEMVELEKADGAIANISITASRERVMDFSQPIFASGLQIMAPAKDNALGIFAILLRRDLLLAIAGAFVLLFGGGMVMWALERKHQDYFNAPAREAMFPSFWWALNLVVNGGFEQLAPRTVLGRIFGTMMVVSSLFIVSIFVAKITATLTVDAIQNNVDGVADLYDKRVGTIEDSTAAAFLQTRDIRAFEFDGLDAMTAAFEGGLLDAVVFDAPILAYYANTKGRGKAQMVGRVFMAENYGIALPTGSPLAERINQALLMLRETGQYGALVTKYFGNASGG